jgi:agmatine deiminase
MSTPARLGFRLPAEWEPHTASWLSWPRRESGLFSDGFEAVEEVYAQLICELAGGEEVHVNVWDGETEARARGRLQARGAPMERVSFHAFPAYEPWCRDHGPMFLVRDYHDKHERAVVDWSYNAFGERRPEYDLDDAVPQHVAKFRDLPLFAPGMVLEGGAIEVNGRGTLLTTESCLLNSNRTPELTQLQVQLRLKDFLGVSNILWLDQGVVGDERDGHVENLARFLSPTTIAVAHEENIDDANYLLLQENMQRLRSMRDEHNRLFRIVKLPMPGLVEYSGQRLPASYLNFYIANTVVVVPTFRRRQDGVVLETLRKEFPEKRVVGLDATDLVKGFGSFHSIALQEAA